MTTNKTKQSDENAKDAGDKSRFGVSLGDVVPLDAGEEYLPGDPYANPPTEGYIIRLDGTTRPALSGKAGMDAIAAYAATEGREGELPSEAPPVGVARWKRVSEALRPLGSDGEPIGPDVVYPSVHAARTARRKLNAEAASAASEALPRPSDEK